MSLCLTYVGNQRDLARAKNAKKLEGPNKREGDPLKRYMLYMFVYCYICSIYITIHTHKHIIHTHIYTYTHYTYIYIYRNENDALALVAKKAAKDAKKAEILANGGVAPPSVKGSGGKPGGKK